MASKEAYVALPPSRFLQAWNSASLLPSPDIQHMTRPGRHLCIAIHLCMLTFNRFRKFRLWFKKKRLLGHRTNFQKSVDQNQSFFSWSYMLSIHANFHLNPSKWQTLVIVPDNLYCDSLYCGKYRKTFKLCGDLDLPGVKRRYI